MNITRSFLARWFIVTIVTGLVGALLLAISALVLSVLFFVDRDYIVYYCDNINVTACEGGDLRIFAAVVPDPVFPSVTIVLTILGVAATLLLGHLTLFHFYLSKDSKVVQLNHLPFC